MNIQWAWKLNTGPLDILEAKAHLNYGNFERLVPTLEEKIR